MSWFNNIIAHVMVIIQQNTISWSQIWTASVITKNENNNENSCRYSVQYNTYLGKNVFLSTYSRTIRSTVRYNGTVSLFKVLDCLLYVSWW